MSRRSRRRSRSTSTPVLLVVVFLAAVLVLRGCVRTAPVPARATSAPPSRAPRAQPRQPDNRPSPAPIGPLGSSPHVALGIPTDADSSDDVLLDEHEYVVSYNPRRLDPNWVSWRLDRSYLGHVRRRDDFRPDDSLSASVYHVTSHDYLHSGYDRGHMCPSADREATPEINSRTFLMTNMEPQLHGLNAGPWEKLEEHERELAEQQGADLYIVAGGIFDANPRTIGHGVAVPKANFKIIVVLSAGQTANDVTDSTKVVAVRMPNEPGVGAREWTEFVTSVDDIERQTGYDFLDRVPDGVEAVIEGRVTPP